MATRRFGPTRGAGTRVEELEAQKQIEAGALGMVAYAGLLEKGTPGELITAFSLTEARKKVGSYIDDGLLPDSIKHYFENANGAGAVHLVRVTDGNELAASSTLYARNASVLSPMGTVAAKSGGRWAGKKAHYTNDVDIADFTETTIDFGVATWKTDQWKGGYIELVGVANKRYKVVGNTNTGVVTVEADETMLVDLGGAPADPQRAYLFLENVLDDGSTKAVSILIEDGEEKPNSEFALTVYVDGAFVKKYPNLHTDPTNGRYWVDLINDDDANEDVFVTDLWTGGHNASVRPANHYGLSDTAGVAATTLTAVIHEFAITLSPGGGDPTFALGTTDDNMLAQAITLTMTSLTAFDAVSDKFGVLGSGTLGALFTPNNKWTPPFTVTAGGTALAATDVLTVTYKPFVPDSLIGGRLLPDKVNDPLVKFRITDNSHKVITVAAGSDLTAVADAGDAFLVEAPLELSGGRDGNADVVDADYISQAYDVELSPFVQLFGKNYGLVKMATPGVTATAVQKAGVAYAAAKNYQYRYEVPSNITTEVGVLSYINDTLGRSDYAVVSFPTYGSVLDPTSQDGRLKSVSMVGAIHGREARIAVDNDGYHKAEAGIDAILPQVLKIATGKTVLNEEVLNPAGIGVIKKKSGNFVLWGDRTVSLDPAWKFKHHRELMSYYENVLRESFDWLIFAINDPVTDNVAKAALRSFFEPEYVKRAVRGDTFEDAVSIKLDGENNTNATRADGDLFAELSLRLADVVERFIIRVGKQGIFDAVV
jgi:hypothetical protein